MKPEWNKKYTTIALYSFLVLAAVALVIFAVLKFDTVKEVAAEGLSVLTPVLMGVVFAYLLDPVLDFFEFKVYKKVNRKKEMSKLRRGLSLVSVCLCVVIVIGVVFVLLIPQLVESYNSLASSFTSVDSIVASIMDYVKSKPILNDNYETILKVIGIDPEKGDSEIIETVFGYIKQFSPKIITFVKDLASGVYNVIIAFIFCIYVMAFRERLLATARKLIRAVTGGNVYKKTLHFLSITDHKFGGFIKGKLLDSTIIFIICYVVYGCMGLRYYPILAFVTAVMNIIPFFGPFIGAVPVGFIVLVAQPEKLIWTLIAILIVQVVDSNFISPMVLGDSVGLSPVWTLFAILLFGGLFGFYGLLFGVPLFATIYTVVKEWTEEKLEKKQLETTTASYYPHHVDHKSKLPENANFRRLKKTVSAVKGLFSKKDNKE